MVILDPGYESYAIEQEILDSAGHDLAVFEGERNDREGRIRFARGAAGLLVRWSVIDGPLLDALPEVRCLVRYGVGYDNVDLSAASGRGVRVANVRGYANHSVSDHALALMLSLARAIPQAPATLMGAYSRPPREPMPELRSLTLGIIGLGNIGGTLCRKARPLVRRVLAVDPKVTPEQFARLGATRMNLETLFEESDVISLHCDLNESSRHLINRDAVSRMRRSPILVNTARGEVVDEAALLVGLEEGRIRSAGLDVFSVEPPLPSLERLLNHPHVLYTGHYAWYSEEASRELQRRAAENLAALLRGEIPEDCLNP